MKRNKLKFMYKYEYIISTVDNGKKTIYNNMMSLLATSYTILILI